MDLKVDHLVKRERTYYFRWRIPKEFSERIPSREIKCSLRTNQLAKAGITCRILLSVLKNLLRSEASMKLSIEQIRRIIADLVKKSLESSETHIATFGFICDSSLEEGIRHNFTNNLKQNGVEESIIAELVGHAINSMTLGRYGKPFVPKVLLEALNKLDHGIDVFELIEMTPFCPRIE